MSRPGHKVARINDVACEIIPTAGYRGPMWHLARRKGVSASEIAVVLGISPYQSPFDLWWSKRLGTVQPDDHAMSVGRRCEPLVLEDFEAENPALVLRSVGLVQNRERPWQLATPDALAYERTSLAHGWDEAEPLAIVEAKTSNTREGWGDKGSDIIPEHYRAQVLWQMDTLALDVAYVPVWIGFEYRCYEVAYDAEDAEFMRDEAIRFLASLDGEPPPIDGHASTTRRLKSLHPTVVEGDVEVSPAVVRQYLAAKRLRNAAQARLDLAENRLRDRLGDLQAGTIDGTKAVTRSVYDVAGRTQIVKPYTVNKLTVRKPKE